MPIANKQPAPTEYHTSHSLWLIVSVVLFVVAGFVHLSGETKGDNRYWPLIARLCTGDYTLSTGEYVFTMALYTLFLAVPSIIFGWVFQAVLGVVWPRVSSYRSVATEAQS
jgi:hypothetical protein